MADKKISQLTAATIPLVGTEPVPLVQSGNTVKATAQNIANLAIPSQTGNNGKYLTTNGTTTSWGAITAASKIFSARFTITSGVISVTSVYNNTGYTIGVVIGPFSGEQISISYLSTITTTSNISWTYPVVVHNSTTYFPRFDYTDTFNTVFGYYDSSNNPANFTSDSTSGNGFFITGIFP